MASEFARGLVAFGDPFLKALISGQQGQREDRKLELLEETRRGNLDIAQEELLLKQDTNRLAREKFEQENQSFQSGMQLFQGLMRGGDGGQFKATEDKAIGDLSRLKDGIPLAQQATNILEKGNPQDLNDALSEVNNKLDIAKKINRAPTREDKNRIIKEAFNDSAAKNNGRPDMRFAQMINMNDDQLEATNLLSEGQNNQLQTIIQNKISQNQSREDRFFDVFTENEFELRSAFGGSKRGREFLSSVVDPTLKRIGEGRTRRETPTTEIGKINDAEKFGRITPEQARIRREQILERPGFTLSQGQERFDAQGRRIASVAPAPQKPQQELEIVRKIRAAGIDPESAEGREIVKGSLTKPAKPRDLAKELGIKIESGFRFLDPNDPTKGVTPIEGGGKDRLTAEQAAKVQMLRTAKSQFGDIKKLTFDKDGSLNRLNLFNANIGIGIPFTDIGTPGIPFTDGDLLRAKMEFGIQAITRGETGAAMPPAEVENTRIRFMPKVTDTKEIVEIKLKMYQDFINGALKLIDPTGRFQTDRFGVENEIGEFNEAKFDEELQKRVNASKNKTGKGIPAPPPGFVLVQ